MNRGPPAAAPIVSAVPVARDGADAQPIAPDAQHSSALPRNPSSFPIGGNNEAASRSASRFWISRRQEWNECSTSPSSRQNSLTDTPLRPCRRTCDRQYSSNFGSRRFAMISSTVMFNRRDYPRPALSPTTCASPDGYEWSTADKLRILAQAASLKGPTLAAFLREQGLHKATLVQWRAAAEQALGKEAARPAPRGHRARTQAEDRRRIRELEREIAQKDRALAKVFTFELLRKNHRGLWGEGE